MAASGKKFKKIAVNEIVPFDHPELSTQVKQIIFDYYFDDSISLLKTPFTFFGISSLEKQIMRLSFYAAPLDDVEALVRCAHARGEKHLANTLTKATLQAIENGDNSFQCEHGKVIEGMADRLLKLYQELLPSSFPTCLEKINFIKHRNKKEKKAMEEANINAIHQVFDAIKQHDENTNMAIQKFKRYVSSTKPIHRLHLLHIAFNMFAKRGIELPRVGKRYGGYDGKLGDQFYFNVIGEIEKELSHRLRQLIYPGIQYVISLDMEPARTLDIDGNHFNSPREGLLLGKNFCFDDSDIDVSDGDNNRRLTTPYFIHCYEQLYLQPNPLKEPAKQFNICAIL